MVELFGIDIAKAVADGIQAAGDLQKGTLTKGTDTHTFSGFVVIRQVLLQESAVSAPRPVLSILGATVDPPATPETNDEATIGSITYKLGRTLRADPAQALYEFEVE